jgi:uncharacterized protein YhaN
MQLNYLLPYLAARSESMRIDRLDLTAFGIFTNESLDLSKSALHVIQGPNAAGKSTARAAVSNLLFGFGRSSSYAFIHPLNRLQVGARIVDKEGKVLDVIRYKRDRDDLIDSASQLPINPGEWSAYLQGVSQVDFDRIYTLGWRELLEGTSALLSTGGALGEALFASGLGIREFSTVLDGLQSEADKLFAPRAQKLVVNAALRAAEAARKETTTLSVRPTRYDTTRRDHDKVVARRRSLADERITLDQQIERLTTLRGVLPQLRERTQRIGERDEILSAGPVPPAAWAARVEAALAARSEATRERSEAVRRGESATGKLAELMSDPEALEIAEDVDSLAEEIKAYAQGISDRSGLEQGRFEAERQALEVLKTIVGGSPITSDLDAALPIVGNRKALASARDDWTNKESKLSQTRAAFSTTEDELADVKASLDDLPTSVNVKPLRSMFNVVSRRGDLDAALTAAQTRDAKTRAELSETAGEIGLTEDGIASFLSRSLPTEAEVEDVLEEIEGHLSNARADDDRVTDGDARIADHEQQLSSLALESDLPTEEDLSGRRDRRRNLWEVVKATWLEDKQVMATDEYVDQPTLAVAFERSTDDADETVDRLWRDADRTSTRNNLLAQLERERSDRTASLLGSEESREKASATYAKWTANWTGQTLPTTHTSLRSWSRNVEELKKRHATWTEAKLTHREAFREVRDARGRIVRLLTDCGTSAGPVGRDLASVLDMTKSFLDAADLRESERKSFESAKGTLVRRLPKQMKAADEAKEAERTAAVLFQSLSSPYGAGVASPIEAGALLGQLEDLDQRLSLRAGRYGRITGIDGRSVRFESETKRLVDAIAGPAIDDYAAAARGLVQRVKVAREVNAARDPLLASEALATSEVDEADATLSGIEEELELLGKEQVLTDLDVLGGLAERAIRVAQLDEEIAEREGLLAQQGGGMPIALLEADANGLDFSQIDAEITRSQEGRNNLTEAEVGAENEERELDRQLRDMDGSDKAALRSADAQFELGRAEEGSARFVRLTLARYLANEAVRRYAEAHQDPILERASTHLAMLTDGAYVRAGVTEDFKKTTLLSAVTAGGEEWQIHELSSGTRDALYLSLRLAALEAAVERTGPMPIVLDDILVNLDEDHSLAALRSFANISSTSQVLLFTHHAHVVDLAENVLSSKELAVHHLAAASSR